MSMCQHGYPSSSLLTAALIKLVFAMVGELHPFALFWTCWTDFIDIRILDSDFGSQTFGLWMKVWFSHPLPLSSPLPLLAGKEVEGSRPWYMGLFKEVCQVLKQTASLQRTLPVSFVWARAIGLIPAHTVPDF